MVFNHTVNCNGKYYAAGENVPIENTKEEREGRSNGLPFSDGDITFESAMRRCSWTELEGMTVKQIKAKAAEKGFSLFKTLKKDIINEFLEKQG